jgi:hypothetical protein
VGLTKLGFVVDDLPAEGWRLEKLAAYAICAENRARLCVGLEAVEEVPAGQLLVFDRVEAKSNVSELFHDSLSYKVTRFT